VHDRTAPMAELASRSTSLVIVGLVVVVVGMATLPVPIDVGLSLGQADLAT